MFHHFWFNNRESRRTVLQVTADLDYGYGGLPLVTGQVNIPGGDSSLTGLVYGYAGLPFVTWTNIP